MQQIVCDKSLTASGVYGFFPANTVGDDIELYTDETREHVLSRFHTLRQQGEKSGDNANKALADYIAPRETGLADYLGGVRRHRRDRRGRPRRKVTKTISTITTPSWSAPWPTDLAEAFAEYLHKQAREDSGYGRSENLTTEDLIKERYRGIRPAPGYPACPDHTEKRTLFDLLQAEQNAGITLTESMAMYPAASVSGLYFSHPQAKYFSVGKIERDQVEDYARRKGLDLPAMERWLSPVLNYDPE